MKDAFFDLIAAHSRWRLIGMLGWQDIRHRYRRSLLGPFWITISTAVLIATIGLLFGSMLPVSMAVYIPYVAAGMVVWQFASSLLTDSCQAFMSAAPMIKQGGVPIFAYFQRIVWRNLMVLAHNIVIIPVAFLLTARSMDWLAWAALPGFLLLLVNLGWVALILAVLSTRYRDLPQTVTSVLPTLMFLTPIIWMPELMPQRLGAAVVTFNPIYRLLLLVRGPLLGELPSVTTYVVCILTAVVGWAMALALYARARNRIVYWL